MSSTTGAILAWTNYAKTATITASSAAMPASNVMNDQGGSASAWQTVNGVVSAVTLSVAPTTTAQTWRVVGIFGTNLSAAASVTFALYNNPTTLVASQVIAGPVGGSKQVVWVPTQNYTADWLKITITDASNPDGFLNVPLLFCGPAWCPAGSVGFNSSLGRDDNTAEVITRGGQEYPSLYWQRRRWNIELDSIRSSELWTQVDPLFRYSKAGSNVFFAPDRASANLASEAIFGRLKNGADITFPYQGADRRRWSASVTERL